MTIEEVLAALQEIIDAAAAEARPLTEEEMDRSETLEGQLNVLKRSAEITARVAAYQMPNTAMLRSVTTGAPSAAALQGVPGYTTTARDEQTINRAFDVYMRTGVEMPEMAQLRAQSVGVGTAGGFTVPESFRQTLTDRLVAFGGFATVAEEFTTSDGRPMPWPTLDDTANQGQVVAEGATPAAGADLVFGEKELNAWTYTAPGAGTDPLRVSVELLQDSAFNVQDLVQRKLSQRIARLQAAHWVNGTGTGQPDGITASTGPSVTFTTPAPTYAQLVDAKHALDPDYREAAVWTFNDSTLAAIEKLVDSQGRPLLMNQAESGIGGEAGLQLLGHRVVIDQAFANFLPTGVSNWGAFVNGPEAYVIRRVKDVQLIVNPYSRANQRQVEYTVWSRADGTVQNPFAAVVLKTDAL